MESKQISNFTPSENYVNAEGTHNMFGAASTNSNGTSGKVTTAYEAKTGSLMPESPEVQYNATPEDKKELRIPIEKIISHRADITEEDKFEDENMKGDTGEFYSELSDEEYQEEFKGKFTIQTP